jgi:hypothetical protein
VKPATAVLLFPTTDTLAVLGFAPPLPKNPISTVNRSVTLVIAGSGWSRYTISCQLPLAALLAFKYEALAESDIRDRWAETRTSAEAIVRSG